MLVAKAAGSPKIMNTLLKIAATVLATGFPLAFTAESFGLTLPGFMNASTMFGTFVVAVTVLTLLTEYSAPKAFRSVRATATPAAPGPRTSLPLAA